MESRTTGLGTAASRLPVVRGRWAPLALALLAGASMAAAHAPAGLPWVMFLAVPALVWLAAGATTVRAAAALGWSAGFGYFVAALHWIGNAFLVDPDQFALLMPLGVIALPAYLALYWAAAFAAARWLWPGDLVRGTLLLGGALDGG